MPQNANAVEDTSELQHAPKIFTSTCHINFEETVEAVHNLVRGLSPFPGAFTYLNGKMFKIFATEKEISSAAEKPGTIVTDNKTFLKIACSNGYIHCLFIQLEGKKKMLMEDFLRGTTITATAITQVP
jgi:methionyl-tRNA formyltransferase